MITAEQIPDEVLAMFPRAWFNRGTLSKKECLAAAFNAWPDMRTENRAVCDVLILPIRKKRDE
jgi:hypothetical protein